VLQQALPEDAPQAAAVLGVILFKEVSATSGVLMSKPQHFYIVDGHSQIHRFFHTPFRPLNAPDGEPTKATFLFTKYLLKLLREKKPAYIAVAMDSPRELLLRRKIDPEYKAGRGTNSDIGVQIRRISQIIKALGIPLLRRDGYEADDVIATLAGACVSDDVHAIVVSRDKDLMQLLDDPRVKMYDPMGELWIDPDYVMRRFGVLPKQIAEFLAIVGDASDNIKGCKGVGEKTAAKWLGQYGDAKGVLRNCRVLGKLGPMYATWAAMGFLEKNTRLTTLCRDVPLAVDEEQLAFKGLNLSLVKPIFRRLAFHMWS
jgi:DNA polymerase-1